MRQIVSFVLVLSFLGTTIFPAQPAKAQTVPEGLFGGLNWRLIGPFRAGRALAVTGVPGRPERFYFGAVGGGIWRSDNAGRTWSPIADSLDVASIGAIAVAPSDPQILYAGSGEADMRSDIQHGDGIYKSTDGGKTWSHIGLDGTRQIGRIIVDPRDAQTLYAAALGDQYGPNAQRGVFKSTDGGGSWSKVLYIDANTGAIDLSLDPADSNVLFASMWQTRRPPWNIYPPSDGPDGGLFKTSDGGKTWNKIAGHGFPGGTLGHIGIVFSPARTTRIYTTVDTNNPKTGGIIHRSDDGGQSWTHTDGESRIWKRGWYFGGITADPKNADEVYVMNTSTYRSLDGGKSFIPIKGAPGGDDYHSLWIDPNDPSRMILGSDQGVVVSVDGAKTWSSWYNQPTGQFYHVSTDNRFPYWVYGAQQDSGAIALPSRSRHAGIGMHDWQAIDVGGESGSIAVDPLHPAHLYGNAGSGTPATYEDIETGWEQTVEPTLKYPDRVWRTTWTLPIAVSPQNGHVVYASRQEVFRSADSGHTWAIISPDLTRQHNVVPSNLDAPAIADNQGLSHRGDVYWLAPSPARAHELWAGTDDGFIWLTRDEGKHWQNVTPPQLTAWSKVGVIDASHFDGQTAYAAVDRHRLDDDHPYIYRTHDGGSSWAPITNGIPANESVNVVREDPKRPGLLYAGTERSMYVSFDDGNRWQSLRLNLPVASVRDIAFGGDDIVIATHGRAFWILDDAAPLRQVSAGIESSSAHLFKPAVAYRTRPGSDEGTPNPPEEPIAKNPPTGALIDYYVEHANGPLAITIADARGTIVRRWLSTDRVQQKNPKTADIPAFWLVRTLPPSAAPGGHRFVWDLHFHNSDGPLSPPGTYAVRLSLNGSTYVQHLTLRRDPTYPASDADLQRQFELAQAIGSESALVARESAQASSLLKKSGASLSSAQRLRLEQIIGTPPQATPDDSIGKPALDFGSFRFIGDQLQSLLTAVEAADARPTGDQEATFALLKAQVASAMSSLDKLRMTPR